jgi:hypothetical protein
MGEKQKFYSFFTKSLWFKNVWKSIRLRPTVQAPVGWYAGWDEAGTKTPTKTQALVGVQMLTAMQAPAVCRLNQPLEKENM